MRQSQTSCAYRAFTFPVGSAKCGRANPWLGQAFRDVPITAGFLLLQLPTTFWLPHEERKVHLRNNPLPATAAGTSAEQVRQVRIDESYLPVIPEARHMSLLKQEIRLFNYHSRPSECFRNQDIAAVDNTHRLPIACSKRLTSRQLTSERISVTNFRCFFILPRKGKHISRTCAGNEGF